MLVEDPQMQYAIRKLVSGLAMDPALQDDLMQEGLIRLWRAECETPGRTRSWYLQNCRFCVLHWLALGRSVDSPKRASVTNRVSIDEMDGGNDAEALHGNGELLDAVSFRDLVSVLARQLTQREQFVLKGLANGLRLREVASEFRFSYPTALKCRRRIAALLLRLGIPEPLLPQVKSRNNRSPRRNGSPAVWTGKSKLRQRPADHRSPPATPVPECVGKE